MNTVMRVMSLALVLVLIGFWGCENMRNPSGPTATPWTVEEGNPIIDKARKTSKHDSRSENLEDSKLVPYEKVDR